MSKNMKQKELSDKSNYELTRDKKLYKKDLIQKQEKRT